MSTPLIEELVRRGRLDSDQAERLGAFVAERGGTADTVLLELGWSDETTILSAMSAAFGLSVASPSSVRSAPDAAAVRAFPEQWARKHMLAPLALDHDRGELSVLAIPPPDPAVLERLSGMLELRVLPLLTTEVRVHERLSLLYGAPVPERFQALIQSPSRRPSLASSSIPAAPAARPSDAPLDNSLRETIARLRDATGRDEIISQALDRARRDFDFAAFFVVTDQQVTGRAASGIGSDGIQKVVLTTSGRSAFATAVRTQAHVLGPLSAEDQRSLSVLGRTPPRTALIIPVRVRDRTVGLIYADQGDHVVSPRAASDLMLFVNAVGGALEGLVMRRKGASGIGPAPARPSLAIPRVSISANPIEAPAPAPEPASPPRAADGAPAEVSEIVTADVISPLSVPPPKPRLSGPTLTSSDESAWAMAVGGPGSVPPSTPPKPSARAASSTAAPSMSMPAQADPAAGEPPKRWSAPPPPWVPTAADSSPDKNEDEDTDKIRKREPSTIERSRPSVDALPIPALATDKPAPVNIADDLNDEPARKPPPRSVASRRSLAPAPAAPAEDRTAWETHVSAVWNAWSQPPPPAVQPMTTPTRHSMTPLPAEIVGDADSFPPGSEMGPDPVELRRETWVKASARPYRPGDQTPLPQQVVPRSGTPADDASRALQGHIPVARGEPLPTEHSHVVTVSGRVERQTASGDSIPRPAVVIRQGVKEPKIDFDSLVDRAESSDPAAAAGARASLIDHGEAGLPAIMRRYPGRLTFDPFGAGPMPPLSACGPIQDLVGSIGQAAHPWVAERLDDTLPAVRLLAVHFYATIRVPDVLPRLTRRLHDEEPRIANHAVTALSSYRDDRGFPNVLAHLHARLSSPSANARRHAAKLLATLGDTSAVPMLAALFDRKDKVTFDAVESALAELTKQRFGPSTKRWMAWWETHRKIPRAEWLIEALDGPEPDLRKMAADELRAASGIDPGYQESGPKKARDEAKKRWQVWLARRRG